MARRLWAHSDGQDLLSSFEDLALDSAGQNALNECLSLNKIGPLAQF
jgi:hypothetical protein